MPPVPMNLLLRVNHPKRFSVDTVVPRQGEGDRGWRQTTNWTTAESTKSVPGSRETTSWKTSATSQQQDNGLKRDIFIDIHSTGCINDHLERRTESSPKEQREKISTPENGQ
ncbi:hypothetical protein TNCV_103741 [Trichonephila clavipes]|nr:hypothetical protein TNCV_103741 [Trichonephila clavipes]